MIIYDNVSKLFIGTCASSTSVSMANSPSRGPENKIPNTKVNHNLSLFHIKIRLRSIRISTHVPWFHIPTHNQLDVISLGIYLLTLYPDHYDMLPEYSLNIGFVAP